MRIVVLGKGNMGRPIAALAAQAGHSAQAYGSEGAPVEALAGADIVVIATKYAQAIDLIENSDIAGALSGKIVIDVTNPLSADFMSLTVGHTSSAGEEIANRLPGAMVVKAFNTIFASLISLRAEGKEVSVPVFVAGDNDQAVANVADLATSFGFQTVVAGPLANSRYLEPMTEQLIQLGYGLGHGDRIGFALISEL